MVNGSLINLNLDLLGLLLIRSFIDFQKVNLYELFALYYTCIIIVLINFYFNPKMGLLKKTNAL